MRHNSSVRGVVAVGLTIGACLVANLMPAAPALASESGTCCSGNGTAIGCMDGAGLCRPDRFCHWYNPEVHQMCHVIEGWIFDSCWWESNCFQ